MPKSRLQCKETTCFVPLCDGGYRSRRERLSLCLVPADPIQLAEWERAINMTDTKMTSLTVVCKRHFEDSCIEHSSNIRVNGIVQGIPKENLT